MSSHHIIREKQEPALLILEIDFFDKELLGQLLEWSPTIIVSQDVYEQVWSLGIKIDVVLKQTPDFIETQEHLKSHDVEDLDLLKSALSFLVAESYPSVNIITTEFQSQHYAAFVSQLDIVVFASNKKIFPIKSGFTKWKPAGDKVFIISEGVTLRSCEGLEMERKNQYLTIKDGFYRLNFEDNFIFIAEEI